MNKSMQFSFVGMCIALAFVPVANASLSEGHAEATLESLPSSLTINGWENWGGIHAWDSSHDKESSPGSNTGFVSGQVDIGSAKAKMWTGNLFVAAESLAEPPPNESSSATAAAAQMWYFTANETGLLTFTLDCAVSQQDAETTRPGESAWVSGGGYLELQDSSGKMLANDSFWRVHWATDEGRPWSDSGTISVSYSFDEGVEGRLYFNAQSQGGATTVVPLPGAMLLGSLGMSLASWMLYRRRTA